MKKMKESKMKRQFRHMATMGLAVMMTGVREGFARKAAGESPAAPAGGPRASRP